MCDIFAEKYFQVKKNISTVTASISFLIVFLANTLSYAQTPGRIAGKILDKKTGETLIGSTVSIKGVAKATATNVEGRYLLTGISPGKYTLLISYIGYQTKEVSEVEVKSGEVTTLDAALNESSGTALNEVKIIGTLRRESISALYAQQKNSVQISDGISADVIKKSPDRNTSDVLKRVSGTSIQDGKFVIVRGLSERYNSNLLNNAQLPSSEPDKKAFAFDIIPSSLIDNIVIYKSGSPDLPGDFSGGLIKTNTRDIPDSRILDVSVNAGYNSKTTFKNNFISPQPHGSYDFLGFDDGSRDLPTAYANRTKSYTNLPDDQKLAITQKFPNNYSVESGQTSLPNIGFQFTTGNSKLLKNDSRLGYNFSLNYATSHNVTEGNRIGYNPGSAGLTTPNYSYDRNDFANAKRLGGLLNFAYIFGKSKIAFRNLYNNDFTIDYEQTSNGLIYGTQTPTSYRGYSIETTQNGLYSSVLEGKHNIGARNIIIDWNLSYGLSYRNQPDQRIVTIYTPSNQPEYISLSSQNSPKPNDLGRVYSSLTENIYGGNADITYPFKWLGQSQKLKAGGLVNYRDRSFTIDALGYTDANGFGNRSVAFANGITNDNIFSPESIKTNGLVLNKLDQSSTNYDGTANLDAGYLMLYNKFTDKLHLSWGARMERYNQILNAPGKKEVNLDNTDVLPSANLTYNLTEKVNLRASFFDAVNRPEFRELADFRYFDYQSNYTIIGNPLLRRSTSSNADVRFEYFPSGGEVLSVSGFYKKFIDPIEQIQLDNDQLSYQNAVSAKDIGIEFELRKNLNFISDGSIFKNFTFYVNASYINAKVTLRDINNNPYSASTPLQGQSPYLINSGLYYTNNKGDFSFNVLYNRIGERLKYRGVQGSVDTYEKPRDVIDFQISKKLTTRAELKLTLSDLLAQTSAYYFNYGNANRTAYTAGEDKIIQNRYTGTSAVLSFRYNFGTAK